MRSNPLQKRLGPQKISGVDRARLNGLAALMNQQEKPALVGASNERMELPSAIYTMLREIVTGMREGRTMILVPENEVMTTQAAANYLGVSRPHVVKLLENGEIPHHTVGTHRRVHFGDIVAYGEKRDQERRSTLDDLTKLLSEEGVYDSPPEQ